eukprot:COSAG02_NODE_19059_length_902_cov_1.534247_1_plen_36_part_01
MFCTLNFKKQLSYWGFCNTVQYTVCMSGLQKLKCTL